MTLAPPGTPLWHAQKDDFAPRLGLAWQPLPNLVLRTGAGIFYDLGYSAVADGTNAFPFSQEKVVSNTSFPLSASAAAPPPFTMVPPVAYLAVVDPSHVLPRTYEWNAAVEKTLGQDDILTVTYLGAAARKLMRQDIYYRPNPEFTGEFDLMRNDADSSYQALQASSGIASRSDSKPSFPIRGAMRSMMLPPMPILRMRIRAIRLRLRSAHRPTTTSGRRSRALFPIMFRVRAVGPGTRLPGESWSTDSIIYARSALPVNVVTGLDPFAGFLPGASSVARPDPVYGVPLWIADPNVAGGKEINMAAFSIPSTPRQGALGRNALRGFGATQIDLTLRRRFKIRERLSLQARVDIFNIFNHPNFGSPVNDLGSPQFGQSTQMLAGSLGSGGPTGGLNPLYQIGGPRSVQLAVS